ncbi:DUF892 family protein [Weeksellaceae bacterium TAE3-ERU29]|nr:DUF892 family protein [Weeksellaceae bacterium TAE3-ERU29]
MENYKTIFELELKNLYASEKQICETLSKLDNYILDDKAKKLLEKAKEEHLKNFLNLQKLLKTKTINPGSTKDSIISEMSNNFESYLNTTYSKNEKEVSIIASLIRLFYYQNANFRVAQNMSKSLDEDILKKMIKKMRKKNKKKIKALKEISSSIFKNAGK